MAGGGGFDIWYKPPAELEAWLDNAAAGDEFTYAHAPVLGRYPIVGLVQELVREREVTAAQRTNCAGKFYIVQRTAGQPIRARRAVPKLLPALSDDERAVLTFLRLAARDRRVCPSNQKLAVLAKLPDRNRVKFLIERLKAAGVIAITPVMTKAGPGRIVTIVRTGKATRDPREGAA